MDSGVELKAKQQGQQPAKDGGSATQQRSISRAAGPRGARGSAAARPKAGFWKKQARTWHWISGAICLIGMLLFSVTGITLNHAADISAEPTIAEQTLTLPEPLVVLLKTAPTEGTSRSMPKAVRDHINAELGVALGGRIVEWTPYDAYVALPRPGGDAWLSVDRESGQVTYELTTRGPVAYLNDLHKGRNTGAAWSWFLDIFSVASILFCLTGLWLLQIHAGKRPSTWPLTGMGLLLPVLLAVFFIH